jgi:hypothetical protein
MGTRTVIVPGRATNMTAIQQDVVSDKLKLFLIAAFLVLGLLVAYAYKQSPGPRNELGSPFSEGKTGGAIVQPAPGFGSHESGGSEGVIQMK